MTDLFAPTDVRLNALVSAIDIPAYERTRNHLSGKVTRLSPYLCHGLISVPELFERLPTLTLKDKLAFEFGWREFFQHVWQRSGDSILADMRPPLPDIIYSRSLPEDICEGRTGLAVIDRAVHELYQTGYLHNHARMWLASYVVHLRKVHWRLGADWMYGHLLDGDLASNHLSWQWIAATFSNKPYLFNADNVAKNAPAAWHCSGSALDTSYEALEHIARTQDTLLGSPTLVGMPEPALLANPPQTHTSISAASLHEALADGKALRLVHPWMLQDAPYVGLRLGVVHLPFHQAFPWSEKRWAFVMDRMAAVTDALFIGDLAELSLMLKAHPAESIATLYPGYRERFAAMSLRLTDAERQFPSPAKACRSFSAFWSACTASDEHAPRRSWHR